MKILKYLSDIHLELRPTMEHPKLIPYWQFNKSIHDDYYLALVGDIGNFSNHNLQLFLKKVSPHYKQIFYIPGNHEYYNGEKNEIDLKLKQLCESFDNIMYMNNHTFMIDDIKIIGSTLWTKISDVNISRGINDYYNIKKDDKNITIDDTNQWNREAIQFIEKELTSKCIVLTHHAPLYCNPSINLYTADPIYLNGKYNDAFHNDLSYLFKNKICVWIYGHTHYANQSKYNQCILATNQLGYKNEESSIKFNPYAYIDLGKL